MPVLSNITAFIFPETSKASAFLKSIPSSAPFPVPTIIAVGVASPKAQGQAITSTDTNTVKENTKL